MAFALSSVGRRLLRGDQPIVDGKERVARPDIIEEVRYVTLETGFWSGRRVLLTGHTGFKGAWLALWLKDSGALVTGFSLPPPSTPNLYELADVAVGINSIEGDVRRLSAVTGVLEATSPEVIFHLAAQSQVRASYDDPVGTLATNILGTAHLLDAARRTPSVRVIIIVTSDKCYENDDRAVGYGESAPLGGRDPYSASKGCAELVAASYRRSFFSEARPGPAVATVRAGNVIGGGDWASDRLVPDAMRAFTENRTLHLRNPRATRPWQHVLEPLAGYRRLAYLLWHNPQQYSEAWNFGPDETSTQSVEHVVRTMAEQWGAQARWEVDTRVHPYESQTLKLDSTKARTRLGWRPRLDLQTSLTWTVDWHRKLETGGAARALTLDQIKEFESLP